MSNWLCDSNVISELMSRFANPKVLAWASAQDSFGLSVVTVEEIYCGLEHKKLVNKEAWFERFLEYRCSLLPVNASIAARAGQERGRFLARGMVRTQADMIIAATAWKYELTLVTRNTKDFSGSGVPLLNPFE